jgi:hypothetical protein
MLTTVDPRIAAIVTKVAGEKLPQVLEAAEYLVEFDKKTPARSLADALEKFKLV